MGSDIDHEKCPQCGGIIYGEYYYKTEEVNEVCMRCGKWVDRHLPRDEDELKLADKYGYIVSSGGGFGRCKIQVLGGFGQSFSLGEPYDEDFEKWYTETMENKEVDPENSYLTRWDAETEQLVVVHGKDPGLYDEIVDEVEDSE